jgi:hypothetical protein
MPELARRFYPATLRLRELLATKLGRPRLILGQDRLFGFDRYGQPGPTTQMAPAPLLIDPGSYLLDWCRFLFQGEPRAVRGAGGVVLPEAGGAEDFESLALEFPEGGRAQIAIVRYHRHPWGDALRFLPPPGFQVYAERGAAWLELPDRIQWADADGPREERLPLEPTVGEVLNDQFHRMVRGAQSLAPTLDDALAVSRLVDELQADRRRGADAAPRDLRSRHEDGSRPTEPGREIPEGSSPPSAGPHPEGEGTGPAPSPPPERAGVRAHPVAPRFATGTCVAAVALAALVGLGLLFDAIPRSSASYDEVAYLQVAADWWRTGSQERITRWAPP